MQQGDDRAFIIILLFTHTDNQISKGVEIKAERLWPHPPGGGEGHRTERDERFQQLCDPAAWQQGGQQSGHDVHPPAAVLSGRAAPSPLTHGQQDGLHPVLR